MFEITGDDIAALGDADLRSLIGLLCQAEMRRRGQRDACHETAVSGGGADRQARYLGGNCRITHVQPLGVMKHAPAPCSHPDALHFSQEGKARLARSGTFTFCFFSSAAGLEWLGCGFDCAIATGAKAMHATAKAVRKPAYIGRPSICFSLEPGGLNR
jgi:hypothetical protein